MVQERIRLSLVIPCKCPNDAKLKELLASIKRQDFPTNQMEVLVISEGTSESAKAIGIRKSKGDVIGILASDNELVYNETLSWAYKDAVAFGSSSPAMYHYEKNDDMLNRYFSLIGGNDVLSYYMGKNDRSSFLSYNPNPYGTIGDNGYFVRRVAIDQTDLNNYFHIDNALESWCHLRHNPFSIWHKTGGNFFKFFAKRYRYGLQHAFNPNRRWHLVDFKKPQDIRRLAWFILATLTVIQPIYLSLRGYLKIRDRAWFLHWPVCMATLLVYTVLIMHHGLARLTRSLSVHTGVRTA